MFVNNEIAIILILILNETCFNYPTVLLFMSHVPTLIKAHFT
jgi:hypothetical protein